ncbi:hypothetical protein TRFO_17586 [Tritrichomonas foetus]|uniref:Uncharacterized protein n=1 Tax=Tritrichomonas foetus TaxID=1144522 RepID=A0A1J4KN45_9EUKA|nr:hypothetical protein TRFO_17586 [Tritrichomonas foetus]|eukprot:OHT12538.1 hypothetical protein TRFO_17586 [Tritrichomonas foetus]
MVMSDSDIEFIYMAESDEDLMATSQLIHQKFQTLTSILMYERNEPFIIQNCQTIFQLALKAPFSDSNIMAFAILSKSSAVVVQSLTKDKYFFRQAQKILENGQSMEFQYFNSILSRLATIFQSIIRYDVDYLPESAILLRNFLPHIENTGVFDLLSSSTSPSIKFTCFFDELMKVNFDTCIIDQIQNSENETEISLLLFLVRQLSRSRKFIKSEIVSARTISVLSSLSNSDNLVIQNSLWQTISSICNEFTIPHMKYLFFKAMFIVSEPYTNLHMYHISVIDFLGKCLYFDSKLYESLLPHFLEVISRLIGQFPDSSNLQASITRFIIAALEKEDTAEEVFKSLVPLIVFTAQSRRRSAASANCAYILHQMNIMKITNSSIRKLIKGSKLFQKCSCEFLNRYETILKQSYGETNVSILDEIKNKIKNKINPPKSKEDSNNNT